MSNADAGVNGQAVPPASRFWRNPFFLLVLALALLLRAVFLTHPYKLDEVFCFFNFGRFPILRLITIYHNTNNHFFYTILLPPQNLPSPRVTVCMAGILCAILAAAVLFPARAQLQGLVVYNRYDVCGFSFLSETLALAASGVCHRWMFLGLCLSAWAVSILDHDHSRRRMVLRYALYSGLYLVLALPLSARFEQIRFFPRSYILVFPFAYMSIAMMLSALQQLLQRRSAEDRRVVLSLAKRLTATQLIQGTDPESDSAGAIYTVQARGFHDFYGLGALGQRPIDTIFLVGPSHRIA